MSRWIDAADREAWSALFTGYEESAYRLEGQQMYSSQVQDEHLARFLSGQPLDIDWTWFRSTLRAQIEAGRRQVKVRIVVEPPTQYTQLELLLYPEMAAAGEEIRIIAVQQGDWPEDQPHYDYWIFDDRDVWRLHYHENFHFKGAELLDDPDARHRRQRDLALAMAVPLEHYLATRAPTDDQERTTA